ncbi:MAG: DUF4214 domain-containing protein [Rhodoferax sp.]|nr:DUF4214 domain-containing protein [Rhodoferax sp.]
MALTTAQIQQAYVTFFNRPADVAGLNYWTQFAGSIDSLYATFAQQTEYTAVFSGLSVGAQVNQVYQNLFGRAADTAGLNYWTLQMNNGAVTLGGLALTLATAAAATPTGPDAVAVASKVSAATAFTTEAGLTSASILGYSGAAANTAAKTWLSTVVDAATLATATAAAALTTTVSSVAATGNGANTAGSTFTLTSGADNFTGTSGNDTFSAFIDATAASGQTLTAADNLVGGVGTDTLNITMSGTGAALPAANISGIEQINVRAAGVNMTSSDLSLISGVTGFASDRSTGTTAVINLVTGGSIGMIGDGTVLNGNSSFAYATATAAVTANVTGGTTQGGILATAGTATTATLNSTGSVANTLTALTLTAGGGTVTSMTVNAAANLTVATMTAADYAATAALTVSGAAAAVNLGATAMGNFKTIDASGLTAGGLTVTLGTNATSFKGGAGNDRVTTAAVATTTASTVDAGAGTADRLIVAATVNVDTAAEAKVYSGFDVLQVGNGVTADAALFTNSTITSLITSGTATVNNVTATQAGAVTLTGSSTTTLNVSGASTVGQIDTVKITVDDGAAAVGAVGAVIMTTPTLAGVEILNLVATDGFTVGALTASTALTNVNVSGAGNSSITTGALALNVNSVIDASASTGTTVINAAAATANGISIKGSLTAVGTLTGSAQADTIIGGAAADVIVTTGGADVVTTGAGGDTVTVAATGALPSSTAFITIADYDKTAGTSTFDKVGAAALILGVQTAAAGAGVATITGGVATFNAADTTFAQHLAAVAAAQQATNGATTVWQEGTDSYMFVSDGTLAVGAADILIKLVGVTAGALTVAGNQVTAMA